MGKFYAVKIGKTPGIYESWDACSAMVHGYPGAVYKSFPTREEACLLYALRAHETKANLV